MHLKPISRELRRKLYGGRRSPDRRSGGGGDRDFNDRYSGGGGDHFNGGVGRGGDRFGGSGGRGGNCLNSLLKFSKWNKKKFLFLNNLSTIKFFL